MLTLTSALVAFTVCADTLSVAKAGNGSGTVTGSPGAIDCGSSCSDTYNSGTLITLTASPSLGSQFTGWLGPCTGTDTCQFNINGDTTVSATFAPVIVGAPRLDIDGTSRCDALTDGLLSLRYLLGLSGASLANGAVGQGASRMTPTQIDGYFANIRPVLDIDGNGHVDALTDGLLIVRYMFGFRGTALIAGAVGSGATRTTADIESRIASLCIPLPPIYAYTIVMANHDYAEIVGSPNAPYINSLIASYGLATNYSDSGTHPDLPNYLYLISGATQYPGVVNLGPTSGPYFPSNGDNLGHQLQAAGISWRAYEESMGTPCKLTGSGSYANQHNPFLYFSNIQTAGGGTLCVATNRDYNEFAGDLAAGTYRYNWISPNLVNDGHDPSTNPVATLGASDTWLATEIPKILASAAYQAGGVIFLTWDQAEGRNGNSADQVPMIIISKKIKSAGYKSGIAYSHANYLATIEDIFGLPRLGAAQGISNMLEFLAP